MSRKLGRLRRLRRRERIPVGIFVGTVLGGYVFQILRDLVVYPANKLLTATVVVLALMIGGYTGFHLVALLDPRWRGPALPIRRSATDRLTGEMLLAGAMVTLVLLRIGRVDAYNTWRGLGVVAIAALSIESKRAAEPVKLSTRPERQCGLRFLQPRRS
jgi:hypothetical protein